nr:hypothetical protein BHI3_33170 [Bacteriovorax sp. HI3]
MKISAFILIFSLLSPTLRAEDFPNFFYGYGGGGAYPGLGVGMGGGIGGGMGSYQFQGDNNQSVPVFDNGLSGSGVQYKNVKVNAKCPLLTSMNTDEADLLSDLKSFLSTASKNPKCSLKQDAMADAMGRNQLSMLETMLNGSDSNNPYAGMGVSTASVKCYSKNVELIGQRNLAYYYAEKKMTQGSTNPFSSCLTDSSATGTTGSTYTYPYTTTETETKEMTLEERRECISKKYESMVEENQMICRESIAPQAVQKQINKGLAGLEQILNQAIANQEDCGFKSQDLFKVTMNTFLKTKALSVVGPWGAVAGFGADLVSNLLDKLFPSDAQKATALMEEILSEETFEQNACLYFNVQQKMYCEDKPVEIATPNPGCQSIPVSSDLLSLIQKYRDIKKVTDSIPSSSKPGMNINMMNAPGMNTMPGMPGVASTPSISPELESAVLDHIEDLSKYAVSNEEELRERVKSLPKMQQSREQAKINKFIGKMKDYQNYDPANDPTGKMGSQLLGEIVEFFSSKDPTVELDLSMFIVRTTPGTKLENIKQKSIARTIEQLMAVKDEGSVQDESSRAMARFNKYKNGMAMLARKKFEDRLEKQFKEFETQVKFVSGKDKGVVNDPVAEGQLRNLVRHCTLLQEVYDPGLEGKMPRVCQKLTCDNNKLDYFKPSANKANFSEFKKNYCDKSLSFQKIENSYIKDLKDKSGAKICGVKADSFF